MHVIESLFEKKLFSIIIFTSPLFQEICIPREIKTAAVHPCHPVDTSSDSNQHRLFVDACHNDLQWMDLSVGCIRSRRWIPGVWLDKVSLRCWVNTGLQ